MAEGRVVTVSEAMNFHSQVASIMEVLANAAVAEICKVVDDEYVVVHLEMSKRQKENEILRRKLKLLELQFARYRAERVKGADGSINSRFHGVRLLNRQSRDSLAGPSLQTRTKFLNRGKGSQLKIPPINLDQDPDQEVVTNTLTEPADRGEEEDVEGELLIIKVEGAVQSTGNINQTLHDTDISSGGDAAPAPLFHAACEGQPRRCGAVMEVSGSDILTLVSKTHQSHTTVRLLPTGSDVRAGESQPLDSHSSLIVIDGGGVSDREGEKLEWSSVDQTNGEAGRRRPDQTALPMMHCFRPAESLRLGSVLARPILSHNDSPGTSSGLKPGPAALQPASRPPKTCYRPNAGTREAPLVSSIPKQHTSIHTKKKAFSCGVCGKSFVCQSQLRVHLNVHTGDKPFRCAVCHRGFSHPSNLKRHQKHSHLDGLCSHD